MRQVAIAHMTKHQLAREDRDDGMRTLISWLDDNGHSISWLAAQLNITRQSIYVWHEVPQERVQDVIRVTGLAARKIRPDMYKMFVRKQLSTRHDAA